MIHLQSSDWQAYERFYRANLINSLTGYKPAMLIGTANAEGQANLAIFSSIVHLGADPALIGYIQRPVGVSGDTFRNIQATGVYTINHVHAPFIDQAHYTSARFGSDISEFDACRLTPHYIDGFAAPFVQESRIRMGLELVEVVPIVHNNTSLVIGKLLHVLMDEDSLDLDGNVKLNTVQSVCVSGLETYHQPELLVKLPYAKVEALPDFK
jgi:flavin reductase (DIM6/NTAB) family NADH-FMN oxidoreductase RutF